TFFRILAKRGKDELKIYYSPIFMHPL
ncbi:FAD binding domain protein, partial [Chlamydia psittaci 06-1683]